MDITLDQVPETLRPRVEALIQRGQQADRLEKENKILREQLRLLHLEKYGRRSEKLTDDQLTLLDGEPSVTQAEVDTEATASEAGKSGAGKNCNGERRRNADHPGRNELPAHLERRVVPIPCRPEDCQCAICGAEMPVIGYEETEELDVIPAHYFVKVIRREKRACPTHPEGGVATAECPPKIIPKSKLSDQMIIDVIIKKYDEHLPVYRQCLSLERDAEVEISRKTLVDCIMKVGGLLEAFKPVLRENLLTGGYIQADETTVPCQSARTRGRNHRAFMWEFSRPGGPSLFDFQMGRDRAGPQAFLKGFKGRLQCDGYSAYDKLGSDISYLGCWAHVRRGFHKAQKLAPGEPLSLEILGLIGQLYQMEEQARTSKLDIVQRLQLRQQKSRPTVEQLKDRIVAIRQEVLPASQLGKACDYALGQWKRLLVFLEDGEVEIDNNWCENAMRGIAVGRKNWLHIGSEQAGPRIAAIMSIFETCRRLEINIRDYLNEILPKLPEWPANRVAELSPMAWKAARQN